MMEQMETIESADRLKANPLEAGEASVPETLSTNERRRAAYRIYNVLFVLSFGVILNSILWLTGHATEYELVPEIINLAIFVYAIQWAADRTR